MTSLRQKIQQHGSANYLKAKVKESPLLLRPHYLLYMLARWYIRRYEGFSHDMRKNGERQLLQKTQHLPCNIIFDIGANVGEWSLMARKYFPHAAIHAFEISDQTFQSLRRNFPRDKKVTLNNFGLAHKNTTMTYKEYGDSRGLNTLIERADMMESVLPTVKKKALVKTGAHYCGEHNISHIDFIKIDVEGAEHFVLQGFVPLLKKQSIRLIQFEYGYTSGDAHFLMKDFYEFFAQFGYRVSPLKRSGVWFESFHYPLNNFRSGPNFVAVCADDKEMIAAIGGDARIGYFRHF